MPTTFEKTWAFDLNRAYAPGSALDLTQHTMWQLAACLTGNLGGLTLGLWTKYASSDSVTSGTDTTDRWVLAGPYDATKIVRGAAAAIHSWIVLRSPSMNGNVWYMILSFNTASDASIRLMFSKTAPTGGTTSVTPTSADVWEPYGLNTGSFSDMPINAAAVDNSRFQFGLTSAGDWYFVGNKQGTGNHNLCFMFHSISNKKATDGFGVYAFTGYLATGPMYLNIVAMSPWAGSSGATLVGTNARGWDGATGGRQCNLIANWAVNLQSATLLSMDMAIPDLADGTYPDLPVWLLYCHSGQFKGVRGRVADLAISPNSQSSLPEATVSPVIGSIDSCRVGHFWFPANAQFIFT